MTATGNIKAALLNPDFAVENLLGLPTISNLNIQENFFSSA